MERLRTTHHKYTKSQLLEHYRKLHETQMFEDENEAKQVRFRPTLFYPRAIMRYRVPMRVQHAIICACLFAVVCSFAH
jgi:hypothetical protein